MADDDDARKTLFEQLRDRVQEWFGRECAPEAPCPFPYPAGGAEYDSEPTVLPGRMRLSPGAVIISGIALPETVAR